MVHGYIRAWVTTRRRRHSWRAVWVGVLVALGRGHVLWRRTESTWSTERRRRVLIVTIPGWRRWILMHWRVHWRLLRPWGMSSSLQSQKRFHKVPVCGKIQKSEGRQRRYQQDSSDRRISEVVHQITKA